MAGETPLQVMKVDSISAEKNTIPVLVLTQMNRLMELMTYDYSRKPRWIDKVTLLQGLYSGIRIFEATLMYALSDEYKHDAEILKAKLHRKYSTNILGGRKTIKIGLLERKWDDGTWWTYPDGLHVYHTHLTDWYALVVSQLSDVGLLPLKTIEVEFEGTAGKDIWQERGYKDKNGKKTKKYYAEIEGRKDFFEED